MTLMFDSNIAKICGPNCAVLLQNIYFWVEKNQANEKHFHDGHYWTYNSMKAFEELFDYMSKNQIRTALDKLADLGLIIKGNYNKDPFDKTAWYSLTKKAYELFERGSSMCEKTHTEDDENPDTCVEKPTSLNNNNINNQTDKNTDSKPDNITVSDDTVRRTDVRRVLDAWNSLSSCGIRPVSKIGSGSKRYISLTARIREYGINAVLEAVEKIRESSFLQGKSGGKRQWMITFDWFVLPSNFPKVLEGNYSDGGAARRQDVSAMQESEPEPEPLGGEEEDLPEDDGEEWIDFSAMSDEEYEEFLKKKLKNDV